ncbi:unnamed protein product [Durusdinium trenchii]|uniref:Vesicle transport protein USE1 n=1 Tax=Durusdinium trenchii TaxID=1381693 RepID=A0ABP0T0J7_9DINO
MGPFRGTGFQLQLAKRHSMPAPVPADRLPPARAEFLLVFAHVEAALHSNQLQEDCDPTVRKAKVVSYEAALRSRLERWELLPKPLAEQYSARIERLSNVLTARQFPEYPQDNVKTNDFNDGDIQQDPEEARARYASKDRRIAIQPQNVQCLPRTEGTNLKTKPILARGEARSNLETEMVDLAENMKGAANAFLQTLKKDNDRLEDMQSAQQRSLDNVSAHTESGKRLLRSGQMSFLCTMILVAISVVLFVMMIPFIIFT